MDPFAPSLHPDWFEDLVGEVERAFEVTGAHTPGWPDPHPDRRPRDEEYSRCLDPGKYRILDARVEAWARVLDARGVATLHEAALSPQPWIGALRSADGLLSVRRLDPVAAGGAALLLATTLVDSAPFGLDVGLSAGANGAVFLDTLPDCGCDACDSGSADLLDTLDGWVLTAARGGVLHARDEHGHVTRTVDGWQGQGRRAHESWLDESRPAPDGVCRWRGDAWL